MIDVVAPAADLLDQLVEGGGRWAGQVARDRLDLLLADVDDGLTDLGRVGLTVELVHAVATADAADRAVPAPAPMADVVMIGGLPRTGTTYLHELLAAVGDRRVLLGWEAFDPGARANGVVAARRQEAADRFAAATALRPKLQQLHRLDVDAVEECTPLLQHSLECLQWGLMVPAPAYVDRLLDTRLVEAYRSWAAQLQQLAPPDAPWLLKSPLHLVDYRSLAAAAPGLRLVHVRRRAVDVVASFLNLVLEARSLFAPVEPAALGWEWLGHLRRLLDRATDDLAAIDVLVVVDHDDLVADPATVVRGVAEATGIGCRGAERLRPTRPPRYDRLPLSTFGLTESGVQAVLADHLGGPFLQH